MVSYKAGRDDAHVVEPNLQPVGNLEDNKKEKDGELKHLEYEYEDIKECLNGE